MLTDGLVSCRSAGWLPVTLALLLGTGIVVCYVWAVVRKDVEAWLPYISEAGGNPPQSGVFAIFLFCSAIVGLLTIMIRYATLYHESLFQRADHSRRLNHVTLAFGLACLLGMIIVASYPVRSEKMVDCGNSSNLTDTFRVVILPHTMGATFVFVIGVLYAFCQALLSLFLRPPVYPPCFKGKHVYMFLVRCICCVVGLAALLMLVVVQDDRKRQNKAAIWKSTRDSVVRTTAEWSLAFMLILLFLFLYPEMEATRLEAKAIAPRDEVDVLGNTSSTVVSAPET